MYYTIKNLRTGRNTKDMISGKVCRFASKEDAEIAAFGMNRHAVVGEKRDRYVVCAA